MMDELLAQGYIYRDLPKMTTEAMNTFLNIVGEENIKWLTIAHYFRGTPDEAVRGQIMISPVGMENMKQYTLNKAAKANNP